jgi:CoA:oxalate CoA-transferase
MGSRHPSIAPFEALATAHGHIVIAVGNDALFAVLCETLGRAELARDPRFASNELRRRNAAELSDRLEAALALRPADDWIERLLEAGVPCGPLNDVAAVVADPQVAARNMVVTAPLEGGGRLEMAGNPVKISGFVDPPTRNAAPALDADRAAIVAELESCGSKIGSILGQRAVGPRDSR